MRPGAAARRTSPLSVPPARSFHRCMLYARRVSSRAHRGHRDRRCPQRCPRGARRSDRVLVRPTARAPTWRRRSSAGVMWRATSSRPTACGGPLRLEARGRRRRRTAGNEPYYVHAPGDRSALSLPAGSSATTAPMCVGIEHPTLRLVARNTGSLASRAHVEVLFEDAAGTSARCRSAPSSAGRAGSPRSPLPVIASLLPLLPGARTAVAFRFTPYGRRRLGHRRRLRRPLRHG